MSAPLTPGGGLSDGERISCLSLPARLTSPRWARRQVAAALSAWNVQPDDVQTAEALVSELVTNSCQAARRAAERQGLSGPDARERIGLTLRLRHGQAVIEVADHDPSLPVMPVTDDAESESGRGLVLIEALSKEWGYKSLSSGGKVVYAVIDAPLCGGEP